MANDPVQTGFRFIAEYSPDGFLLIDDSGRIQEVNPAVQELLATPRLGLESRDLSDFFTTNLVDEWKEGRIDFQDNRQCTRRVSGKRQDGSVFLAELRIQLAGFQENGSAIVIVRDITENESLRLRLRQQEALLKEIPEPIHILDPNGTVVYWNHGAELLFGFSASEAIGRFGADLLTMKHPDQDSSSLMEVYDSSEHWSGEVHVTTKQGAKLRVERRKTVIKEDEEVIGAVVFDTDLGERSRLRQLDRRRQRLESLGTLASGIAHDLNNLLTPIMMSCNMLKRPKANLNTQALLDTISTGASRGKSLISQLLTFARGGDGQHRAVDVRKMLTDVESIVRPTLPEDVLLQTSIRFPLPSILGDETEIGQVLMNILVNARDAVGKVGQIVVKIETVALESPTLFTIASLEAGSYLRIEVKDDGAGMTEAVRERMFDPFYSTKERGQGTGLGLSTALGIVQSHRGALDVQSKVDCGTMIAILLPVNEGVSSKGEPGE